MNKRAFTFAFCLMVLSGCGPSDPKTVAVLPANVTTEIVQKAWAWLKDHSRMGEVEQGQLGRNVLLRTSFSGGKSFEGDFDLTMKFSPSNETVVACGVRTNAVGRGHLAELRELAVRENRDKRDSLATLYIAPDGALKCRASLPYDAMRMDAEGAMGTLVGSIAEKLMIDEDVDMGLHRMDSLQESAAHKPRVEDVVKSWFDEEQGYYTMYHAGDETDFSGWWRYTDKSYTVINYKVHIENGLVIVRVYQPTDFNAVCWRPEELIAFVNDWNAHEDRASLLMDVNKRTVWFQYALPALLLQKPRSRERFRMFATDLTALPEQAVYDTEKDFDEINGAR